MSWPAKQNEKFAINLARRIAAEKNAEKLLPDIQPLIKQFWKSEFKEKMDAHETWQELPFLAEIQGKLYRGQINLVLRDKEGLHIADFKTDNIAPNQVDRVAEKYRNQMTIYSEVVKKLKNQSLSESSILFLKPNAKKKL